MRRLQVYRTQKQGFTLIELLVVILILAVLMAISLPLYLSAVSHTKKKTCRTNLHTIANAIQANKSHTMGLDYAAYMGALDLAKIPDIQVMPLCTDGGSYTVDKGSSGDETTFKVNCSISDHGGFEPGVDSN